MIAPQRAVVVKEVVLGVDARSSKGSRTARRRMRNTKRIVLLGPCYGIPSGQSVVTRQAAVALGASFRVHVVDTNFDGCSTLVRALGNLLAIAKIIVARLGGGSLYISASRSRLGALKDLMALALWRIPLGTRGTMLHLHGSDFASYVESLPRWLRQAAISLYRSADLWLLLTEGMADQFVHFQPRRVSVVENPLPPESFSCLPRAAHGGPIRLVVLSNIYRTKGVIEVAAAVKQLRDKYSAVRYELRIAGAPYDRDVVAELREMSDECPSINYLGPVYGRDKSDLLAWADVMLLPSRYPSEAVPICLLEGAASGCYLIASSAGYIPDLAKTLHIRLLDDTSPGSIALALEELDGVEIARVGNLNRQLARTHFELESFGSKLTSAAESLQ